MEEKQAGFKLSGNMYLWIIGALILLVVGWFGFQAIVAPFQEYKVTLVNAPSDLMAGNVATFTWRVDGPASTINHTAIHLGTTSNPGTLGKDVKPADTKYTEFVQDFASGNYGVPLQFIGNIRLTKVGTYYFRVHALAKDKNYWSDEYTLEVKPPEYKISMVNAPKEIFAGDVASFTWRVDGPQLEIVHTTIDFSSESAPGSLAKTVKPSDTKYTELVKDFTSGKYTVPLQFVGNARIATPGAYFIRGHATVNEDNLWTDEMPLTVLPKPKGSPAVGAKTSPTAEVTKAAEAATGSAVKP
jgi:hypothetical protein